MSNDPRRRLKIGNRVFGKGSTESFSSSGLVKSKFVTFRRQKEFEKSCGKLGIDWGYFDKSEDDILVAVGDTDQVRFFNHENGDYMQRESFSLHSDTPTITCCSWEKQKSRLLALGNITGDMLLFNVGDTSQRTKVKNPIGAIASLHEGIVNDVCFSYDGSKVYSVGCDHTLFETDLQKPGIETSREFLGHKDGINCVITNPSDMNEIITCSSDKSIHIYDRREKEAVTQFTDFKESGATWIDFSLPRYNSFIFSCQDGTVHIVDKKQMDSTLFSVNISQTESVAYCYNHGTLVSGITRSNLFTIDMKRNKDGAPEQVIQATKKNNRITSFARHPTKQLIAVGIKRGTLTTFIKSR